MRLHLWLLFSLEFIENFGLLRCEACIGAKHASHLPLLSLQDGVNIDQRSIPVVYADVHTVVLVVYDLICTLYSSHFSVDRSEHVPRSFIDGDFDRCWLGGQNTLVNELVFERSL